MNAGVMSETSTQSIQMAVFKVNNDLYVEGSNITSDHPLAAHATGAQNERLGDALHCMHSFDSEDGCGFGSACPNCGVRHAILECFLSGSVVRKRLEMNLRKNNLSTWHKFIVTANPVAEADKRFVALIVEDLHSTLSNGKLPLHIDGTLSGNESFYYDIIKDHLIKYRTVTFQPAVQH